MTHDPDQEHTAGADWEVVTGPGGAERESGQGAALRGLWRRQSFRARAVTAAATVAVLALGGSVAYAATSGNSGNSAGSGAEAVPAAAGSASPSPGDRGDRHGRGPRFGLGVGGVHGEATVRDHDTGDWVVRVWQRGTVEKADGDQVTVKSEDGASWTWTVGSDTKVFGDGTDGTSGSGALKKGEKAYLVGTRSDDGTRTATHVLSGTWEKEKKHHGDGRHKFPGHGPRDWRDPSPSPSGSGTTT
ncbi:hypothetical protein AB0I77_06920 [Streptomyces sp. NPDC050619]|uniref:hypothetical protein n=1 Tax=Streptomyces sp. NPDC050619 TaxID=3157214 RepID=UPI003447C71E